MQQRLDGERKIRVAVVFGGRSSEHAISCVSAGSVLSHLDRDRYEVLPVGITREGGWVLGPDDPAALRMRGRELPSVSAAGLAVGDHVVLRPGTATLTEDQRARLGLPAFVKPARAGSSVGITRITDWAMLPAALQEARKHDPKVLVEAAHSGREIECGVLEFPDGSVRASVPAEIRLVAKVPEATVPDFYSFEAKYLDEVTEFDIPAKLDDATAETVREMAVAAFTALDCQGLARVDFFVDRDGVPTINEVNTMPGFTPISLYPRMWAVTGVEYATLLTTLVETALARGTGLR
jgi:D-alanine-D-alanine ligase